MKKDKRRNIGQYFTVALILTVATIKRLLYSKKTIGIVILCLIPILIFSLWHAGVFEDEDDEIKYYANIPELTEPATADNISVSINNLETAEISSNEFEIRLNGTTTGPVDHLSIKLYLYVNGETKFNIFSIINSSIDALRGPVGIEEPLLSLWFNGIRENGDINWSYWLFSLDIEFPVPIFNIETQGRLGVYIRAYSDNISSEKNWSYDYKEIYLEFEEDYLSSYWLMDGDTKKDSEDGYEVFFSVAMPIFFLLIIPLITILYAISAMRDDIENHMIIYLTCRPISKTEIVFYKFKGFFISAWIPIIFSLSVSFFIVASKEGSVIQHLDYLGTMLLLMTLCVLAYGAIFFVFSLLTTYPIVLSLLYVYFWETTIWQIPNAMSRFSIMYHLQSMAHGMLGKIANIGVYKPLSVFESFLALCVAIISFVIVAIVILHQKDLE